MKKTTVYLQCDLIEASCTLESVTFKVVNKTKNDLSEVGFPHTASYVECLGVTSILIGIVGFRTTTISYSRSSDLVTALILQDLRIVDRPIFISSMANFWPMQFLGPALKGMKL